MATPQTTFAKKASDQIPYCKDQGIEYLVEAGKSGMSLQYIRYVFAAGGIVNFANLGFKPMQDNSYVVIGVNQTGTVAPKVAADTTRTANQFVVTGPSVGDTCEFVVCGPSRNQPLK
jgi:hypothetical protein